MTLALFEYYPQLTKCYPIANLVTAPTPVEPLIETALSLGLKQLAIKRDDLSASLYGGNKIRKLDFLLGQAQFEKRKAVLSFGFAGSNFCLATALYAQQLGISAISMLLPQTNAAYVQENLKLSFAAGAKLHLQNNVPRLAVAAISQYLHWWKDGVAPLWVPAGGSSTRGILGFVNAAFELQKQNTLPDVIYLPMGSMGSAVGLAVGFSLLGANIKIVATRVVDKQFASHGAAVKLICKTCKALEQHGITFKQSPDEIAQQVEIRSEFYGGEYGLITAEAEEAQAVILQDGFRLDGTYGAKAMAALIADARCKKLVGKNVLFWHTGNSVSLSERASEVEASALPSAFKKYF